MIVDLLIKYAHKGTPLSRCHLADAIELITSNMPPERRLRLRFKNGRPGVRFIREFYKRHSTVLTFRRACPQQAVRFNAVKDESLITHFATLEKLIHEYNIDDSRLFNLDEAGASPEKNVGNKDSARRYMPRSGCHDTRMAAIANKNRITIMAVISAAGQHAPPLFVLKGTQIPYRIVIRSGQTITESPVTLLPRHAVMAMRAANGGVDSTNFYNWALAFLDYTKDLRANGRKVLLVYDRYLSHLSIQVLKLFKHNSVVVYALPAHTSGKLQPLDTVVFAAFKAAISKALQTCVIAAPQSMFSLYDFCAVLKDAYLQSFSCANIKASFRRSGLWPLDRTRLIGVPRPATAGENAEMLSTEELELLFKRKQDVARKSILGDDAVMQASGFIDTKNGCVVTSDKASSLIESAIHRKRTALHKKSVVRLEKEANRNAQKAARKCEVARLRHAAVHRRAGLAGLELQGFQKQCRSLQERRVVAQIRTLKKRGTGNAL